LAVDLVSSNHPGLIPKLQDTLTLSAHVGSVSEVNIQILLDAISHMQSSQPDQHTKHTLQIEDMFSQDEIVEPSHVQIATAETAVKEIESKIQIETRPSKGKESPFAHIDEKLDEKPVLQKPTINTVTTLDIGARRKKILEVVKSKGQATIHEFIQSIQGCSSKTIQRELTSLVLSGTLKKTGERRWSKYSLR
jgi:hypothetical protein